MAVAWIGEVAQSEVPLLREQGEEGLDDL